MLHPSLPGPRRMLGLGALALASSSGLAQLAPAVEPGGIISVVGGPFPRVVIAEEPILATIDATGEVVPMEVQSVWKPVCGTPAGALSAADLLAMSQTHGADFADPKQVTIVDFAPNVRNGINIVYVLGASVPAAAIPAFAAAEAYIEAQFSDPITVTVTCSFANLSPGVLGGTSSTYGYVTYAGSRSGLVAGMDANDTIQSSLPSGTTVPVRYRTNRTTNEDRIFWTIANYNAAVGSAAGNAANMQYSSTFPFDYDPSDGVPSNAFSFQDVIIHETGHALGFTSGVDFRSSDIEALDLFRFRRTDGSSDFNPDTTAEFTARPRWAVKNNPDDDVNSDLIGVEYRMSDGSPQQASHFREQTPAIGLMDPALGYAQTFYPNFFRTPDLDMFDAIGYDR